MLIRCRSSRLFQSTHPTRGCDAIVFSSSIRLHNFNPRTPRGGATLPVRPAFPALPDFNPRTPRGGATFRPGSSWDSCDISIHAPHEGVRLGYAKDYVRQINFNPRTPRGGATASAIHSAVSFSFQSTHPTRGCDTERLLKSGLIMISIHAPHEGVRRKG